MVLGLVAKLVSYLSAVGASGFPAALRKTLQFLKATNYRRAGGVSVLCWHSSDVELVRVFSRDRLGLWQANVAGGCTHQAPACKLSRDI